MTVREIEGTPSALPTMLKAALPVLPGVALVPGVAKRGRELPDLTLRRSGVTVDREHVAAYSAVCGFASREQLPLTYAHMLAFPLHMGVMTDRSFPFPAIGTVHLTNTIRQHRPIGYDETLTVEVTPTNLRPHPKGRLFDMVATVTSAGETVWESTSGYLRLGRGDKDAPAGPSYDVISGNGTAWRLPGNLGREYAAVSGDHNPIHLYPLTAKAFGFKRQIAHGMWTLARSVAALDNRLADDATVAVEFKKPVFLPGTVAFGSRIDGPGELAFSLTDPRTGAPHLVGTTSAGA